MASFSPDEFSDRILSAIPFDPTPGQREAIRRLGNFLSKSTGGDTYVLKGYAGTGKTTIISALVKSLPATGVRTLLLAPTGRAAKVASGYSGKPAFTIHRRIYRTKILDGGGVAYEPASNSYRNTLIIVDEASMIPEGRGTLKDRNLLQDLITYVQSGDNCRLLLVGDTAQLPPIEEDESPALDIKRISGYYALRAGHFELTEVVRQKEDSGILYNATLIRDSIRLKNYNIRLQTDLPGITRITSQELGDTLSDAFGRNNGEAIVVTRSNKAAIRYNRQIRYSGLWFTEEIDGGDLIMCTRNSYFWLDESSSLGFIANGDILKVKSVKRFEEHYGFRFATLEVSFLDYADHPSFEVNVILESLYSESPSLSAEQFQNLQRAAIATLPAEMSKTARYARLGQDPWMNALHVKFAYAVTCHKAQGGQWDTVFVDAGMPPAEGPDLAYLRWLYTALTRAKKQVYLVNFDDSLIG